MLCLIFFFSFDLFIFIHYFNLHFHKFMSWNLISYFILVIFKCKIHRLSKIFIISTKYRDNIKIFKNIAIGDRLFLGMQDFDFAKIYPNFAQICPKYVARRCDRIPSSGNTGWESFVHSWSTRLKHCFGGLESYYYLLLGN